MKINLGCGDRYADGWVNVDHQGSPHRKDFTIDLRNPLPWVNVTHFYAGHILEHLKVHEVLILLRRLHECMTIDGEIMVVGPDIDKARGMLESGYVLEVPMEQLRWGADRWDGDVHRWECSEPSIAEMLRVSGWSEVKGMGIDFVPAFWPVAVRGPQWQCAVSAIA